MYKWHGIERSCLLGNSSDVSQDSLVCDGTWDAQVAGWMLLLTAAGQCAIMLLTEAERARRAIIPRRRFEQRVARQPKIKVDVRRTLLEKPSCEEVNEENHLARNRR